MKGHGFDFIPVMFVKCCENSFKMCFKESSFPDFLKILGSCFLGFTNFGGWSKVSHSLALLT